MRVVTIRRWARANRYLATCAVLLAVAAGAECGARVARRYKARLVALLPVLGTPVHDYQELDPTQPWAWRLKPGFSRTFAAGTTADDVGDRTDRDVFIRINSDGFRGPEIDRSRPHRRILTIGDSCTFGTVESSSYPRVLERELRMRGDASVEVVNAGVEGYTPGDVLREMPRYAALRPEVVTIYLGWGALYDEADVLRAPPWWTRFESIRLVGRTAAHLWAAVQDPKERARKAREASLGPKRPDPTSRDIGRLDTFVPSFMPDIARIVGELRAAGSTVVLVTLPGLFAMDSVPTARALRIGNLPAFTDNPYVLAKMAARYNVLLRELAARERLQVIDLDAWSGSALVPRDTHFRNAVHLDEQGQEMVGRRMADALTSDRARLAVRQADRRPTHSPDPRVERP